MKISIVYFGVFLSETGMLAAARRIRDIGRGLVSEGHQVEIFLPKRSTDETNSLFDDLNLCYLGKAGKGKIRGRFFFWIDLLNRVEENDINWVIFYNVRIDCFLPAKILRKKNVNVAAEFCDKHSGNIHFKNFSKWGHYIVLKLSENLIPKVTDLNICISHFLFEHCKKYAPNTPRMILPVLVDSERFKKFDSAYNPIVDKWNISKDAFLIAYVGGLWKTQGVTDLINAFVGISTTFPNAHLLIAGHLVKSDTHDDAEGIIDELGLNNRVTTTGWVSTDDVIAIYSRANTLVIPQINVEGTQAGFPTKIAEYAQMGKAIVSTNVSSIGMYFKNNESVLLVKAGKHNEIENALSQLIKDPKLVLRLGQNAQQIAIEHFDYRQGGKKLSNELKKCSNEKLSK